jgi:NAD(P)-dependent dehydrogenase (short-subunit alcohol dehydrogenase family)
VYVTGRSTREHPSDEGVPGTIEDTADAITRLGGVGIPIRCDHTDAGQVQELFARVSAEHKKLDLLVSNAWGGYEGYNPAQFTRPFWEQPLRHWDGMFTSGLRAAMLAAHSAIPLMLAGRQGLIINTIAWLEGKYLGNLYYDVAKAASVRFAEGLAGELRTHGIAVVALAPGFMRTERVMAAHAAHPFDLTHTESPEYIGRAVAALLADSKVMEKSGSALLVGELAREYQLTDIDGRQVPPFRVP